MINVWDEWPKICADGLTNVDVIEGEINDGGAGTNNEQILLHDSVVVVVNDDGDGDDDDAHVSGRCSTSKPVLFSWKSKKLKSVPCS